MDACIRQQDLEHTSGLNPRPAWRAGPAGRYGSPAAGGRRSSWRRGCDGEAEPAARGAAMAAPVEALRHARQLLCRNARPLVLHAQAVRGTPPGNAAGAAHVLHRILMQVPQRQMQRLAPAGQRQAVQRRVHRHVHARPRGSLLHDPRSRAPASTRSPAWEGCSASSLASARSRRTSCAVRSTERRICRRAPRGSQCRRRRGPPGPGSSGRRGACAARGRRRRVTVRSWCRAASILPNRPFSAAISGCTSAGVSAAAMGRMSSPSRAAISRANVLRGRSSRLRLTQMSRPSNGTTSTTGPTSPATRSRASGS